MNRLFFHGAFLLGAAAVIWMASTFIGQNALALTVTLVIGCVYTLGFAELIQFRQATATLSSALSAIPAQLEGDVGVFEQWLEKLHPSLQNSVRLRIEGERVGLPAPIVTPYLVGLLVMLGLLGTFVGMVETLSGAVIALEGTTELQAIRAGLAAPISGLSLAFGTSVAGVSASAMLGLISTLCRRDRMLETRTLDGKIHTVFRSLSLAHSRQNTYKALQMQAQLLPEVAGKLSDLVAQLGNMGDTLGNNLVANQAQFHESAKEVYLDLAKSVESSLETSLAESGRVAGESLMPVVVQAMDTITSEAQLAHQNMTQTTQGQLTALSASFNASAGELLSAWATRQESGDEARLVQWSQSLSQNQDQASKHLAQTSTQFAQELRQATELQRSSVESAVQSFESMSGAVTQQWTSSAEQMAELTSSLKVEFGQLREEEQQRGQAAIERLGSLEASVASHLGALGASSEQLLSDWAKRQESGDEARLAQWSQSLSQNQDQTSEHLAQTSTQFVQELRQATELQRGSVESAVQSFELMSGAVTQQWTSSAEQMAELTASLKLELGQLRDEEQQRGEAAVERLGSLEASVAGHLGALGKELEEPMVRLIEIASETPRAAAEVIGQLRNEISNNIQRDNSLLEERQRSMEQLNTLSTALEQTSIGQREALENMVTSSAQLLQKISGKFGEQIGSELGKMSGIAEVFAGSATEMASLGEAFTTAVSSFNDSNSELMDKLSHIEGSLNSSSDRSDEQMGYYVAQARQIIDQSMQSQREMFEALRQLGQKDLLDAAG